MTDLARHVIGAVFILAGIGFILACLRRDTHVSFMSRWLAATVFVLLIIATGWLFGSVVSWMIGWSFGG